MTLLGKFSLLHYFLRRYLDISNFLMKVILKPIRSFIHRLIGILWSFLLHFFRFHRSSFGHDDLFIVFKWRKIYSLWPFKLIYCISDSLTVYLSPLFLLVLMRYYFFFHILFFLFFIVEVSFLRNHVFLFPFVYIQNLAFGFPFQRCIWKRKFALFF